MKDAVFDCVRFFEHSSTISPGCNSSFITLFPKVKDPLSLRDYRPYSLIGSIYKIIPKLLMNRLKMVVGKVISQEQSTYVEGRKILDDPLILFYSKWTLKKCLIALIGTTWIRSLIKCISDPNGELG